MSNYSSIVKQSNPIGYWRMNDTDSTMVDEMGLHDGIHLAATYGQPGAIVEDIAKSVLYTSADERGSQIPIHNDFNVSSWSVCMWVKFDEQSLSDYQCLFTHQDNGSTGGVSLTMGTGSSSDGKLRVWIKTGSWSSYIVPITVQAHTWYFLTVTYDGTLAKVYINGDIKLKELDSGATLDSTTNIRIGHQGDPGAYRDTLTGYVQDVAFYNRAVNNYELKQFYLIGRRYGSNYDNEVYKANPKFYWRMNQLTGDTAAMDETCNATLTYSGGTITAEQPSLVSTFGTSCKFDGNSWMENANAEFNPQNNQLSAEVWVNFNSLKPDNYIISRRDPSDQTYTVFSVYVKQDGKIQFHLQSSNDNTWMWVETHNPVITVGQTYHIVTTWEKNAYDETDFRVYVDGVSQALTLTVDGGSYNSGFNVVSGSTYIEIGRRRWLPSHNIDATVDHCSIYEYALSESVVQRHYQAGTGTLIYPQMTYHESVIDKNPLMFYTFEETSGSISDVMGNGVDLDPTGAPNLNVNSIVPRDTDNESGVYIDGSINTGGFKNDAFTGLGGFEEISIEVWVKTTEQSAAIISFASSSGAMTNDVLIYIGSGGSPIEFYVGSNKSSFYDNENHLIDGQTHHLTFTCKKVGSQSYREFWMDGVLFGTSKVSSNPIGTSGTLWIGQEQDSVGGGTDPSQSYIGYMNGLSLHSKPLEPWEIRENYFNGITSGKFTQFGLIGTTKLNGAPHSCTIRVYKHDTGDLVGEILSDSVTGEYTVVPLTEGIEYDLLCFTDGVVVQGSGPFTPTEVQ